MARSAYEVVGFYNDIEDRIEQLPVDFNGDGNDDYSTFFNVGDAKTWGVETSFQWQVTDALNFDLFWTELRTENKTADRDLFFNPQRVISISADWRPVARARLGVQAIHTGEQVFFQNGALRTADDYTLVHLNASYALDEAARYELFGGVDNLFDARVDTRLGSHPGPILFFGARTTF